jgi:hypothetical protein
VLWLLLRQIWWWWWWWWWGDSLVETWEVFGGEWGVDFLGVVNLSRYWVPFVSRRIHNVMRRNFLQAKIKMKFLWAHIINGMGQVWARICFFFFSIFFFLKNRKRIHQIMHSIH